jgi:hypothetical protein
MTLAIFKHRMALKWDPAKRETIDDDEANSFLARESRKGYEIQS